MASDDPPLTLDDDDIPAEVLQELNEQLDLLTDRARSNTGDVEANVERVRR